MCASPSAQLAQQLGGTGGGRVFTIDNLVGAKVAQIPHQDARYHPDATSLHKILVELLDPAWIGGNTYLGDKLAIAPLWMPCLPREKAAALFKDHQRLAEIEQRLRNAINFWGDTRLVSSGQAWPFTDGEIFFEAESWCLT